ncbi:cyclic nucleotide-binding protein [Rhodomicrobium vannielii ATCC 17100]|uniref:Cyclic nucleotide-binding protein n=1 Tax=Rhodomicrobium vannielii (strain ATCC 17100 / DSM 162 / LMG 4299 / NCIMB 10020 / ATH 3.1.1) TaxID=648757 RepID=E3HZZ6_RHOVT|nr:cyclic nucleotide-binding domain-containing protein [Rhodomicrobium vannielii]ADP69947.1 cyclic nucleotide-binding protein [Rhodomicrobium vannielii ATCC 17100]
MEQASRTLRLLQGVPAFAGLSVAELERVYACTSLRVVGPGETVALAGEPVDDLAIVASGRLKAREGGAAAHETGQGDAVEAQAFFGRGPASSTHEALRETVLLSLAWDDLVAAYAATPSLIGSCLSRAFDGHAAAANRLKASSRLLVCPAGANARLDKPALEALLLALEETAEVRVLRQETFGGSLPGALAFDDPAMAHWLQEQELKFDVTVVIADGSDQAFAADAVCEADEIVFLAQGRATELSDLERHAIERRGPERCSLVIASDGIEVRKAAEWLPLRPYRTSLFIDFSVPRATGQLASALLGRGSTVVATSSGVYAAAILGALQAFEASGAPATALAAAGSAVLPAGMLACGVTLADAEDLFRELANPLLWKRAGRAEAGLYEALAVDAVLGSALAGLDIALASRPFAALSLSLSKDAPAVHCGGGLHAAIRAGILPPGLLPPLIPEDGAILVSGECETEALLEAAERLSPAPPVFLHPAVPGLGASPMSYRQAVGGSQFRLAPFQSPGPIDKRLRIESVLGAYQSRRRRPVDGAPVAYAVPVAEGISPMDWGEWARLRDAAFDWMSAEIEKTRVP